MDNKDTNAQSGNDNATKSGLNLGMIDTEVAEPVEPGAAGQAKPVKSGKRSSKVLAAALVLGVAGAGWWLFFPSQNTAGDLGLAAKSKPAAMPAAPITAASPAAPANQAAPAQPQPVLPPTMRQTPLTPAAQPPNLAAPQTAVKPTAEATAATLPAVAANLSAGQAQVEPQGASLDGEYFIKEVARRKKFKILAQIDSEIAELQAKTKKSRKEADSSDSKGETRTTKQPSFPHEAPPVPATLPGMPPASASAGSKLPVPPTVSAEAKPQLIGVNYSAKSAVLKKDGSYLTVYEGDNVGTMTVASIRHNSVVLADGSRRVALYLASGAEQKERDKKDTAAGQ